MENENTERGLPGGGGDEPEDVSPQNFTTQEQPVHEQPSQEQPFREQLAQAQLTIAEQAEAIERLKRQLKNEREDESFAHELREALTVVAAAGTVAAPIGHSRLLELIVEAAAQVIAAEAAALFLVDEATQELIFEVVLGGSGVQIKKTRLPLGQGIAGLVAVTSQPIAIAEAEHDPRVVAGIDYKPRNVLCVPLFYNDRTIGVLGLYDKVGAAAFSVDDMDSLGHFAKLAAIAIEQSRTQSHLTGLIGEALLSFGGLSEQQKHGLGARGAAFAARLEAEGVHQRALEMARLVREIVQRGENEAAACRSVLRGFADYIRLRDEPLGVQQLRGASSSSPTASNSAPPAGPSKGVL